MENVIKIVCPVCGSVLTVKSQPDIESKYVTCPVCKTRSPFSNFKKISTKNGHANEGEPTKYFNGSLPEDSGTSVNQTLGRFLVPSLSISFDLKEGKNIIGRMATGSSAQCQIPCSTKRLSREHLIIEAKKVPDKGFVHYASLYKDHVNATFVGDNRLKFGQSVILNNNDLIRLPDVEGRFIIPEEESTIF